MWHHRVNLGTPRAPAPAAGAGNTLHLQPAEVLRRKKENNTGGLSLTAEAPRSCLHPSPAGGARHTAPAASPGMLQRGRGGGRREGAAGPCSAGRRPGKPGRAAIPKENPRLPSRCHLAVSPGTRSHPRSGRAMVSPGSAGTSAGAASSLPRLPRTGFPRPPPG